MWSFLDLSNTQWAVSKKHFFKKCLGRHIFPSLLVFFGINIEYFLFKSGCTAIHTALGVNYTWHFLCTSFWQMSSSANEVCYPTSERQSDNALKKFMFSCRNGKLRAFSAGKISDPPPYMRWGLWAYTSLESAICRSAALCLLNLLENLLNKSFRWMPKSKVSPATAAAAAAAAVSRG